MLIKFRIGRKNHCFQVRHDSRVFGSDIWLMWLSSAEYRRKNDRFKIDLSKDNLVDALYEDDRFCDEVEDVIKEVEEKIDQLRREALQEKINEVYRKGIDVGVDFDNLKPTPIYIEYEHIDAHCG